MPHPHLARVPARRGGRSWSPRCSVITNDGRMTMQRKSVTGITGPAQTLKRNLSPVKDIRWQQLALVDLPAVMRVMTLTTACR